MVQVTPPGSVPAILPRPAFLMYELRKDPFLKRLSALKTERSYYEQEMREIARFIRPRRGRFLGQRTARDEDRMARDIINTTAPIASRTLKSGMQSGVSSPARPWFKLTTPDPDMAESGDVKQYLTTVARRMATVFQRSNIYNSLHTGYGDLGDFGTSCMMIDENFNDVIRCHVYSPGSYYLATDGEGKISTVYREMSLSVLACVQRWGKRVSDTVMRLYDAGSLESLVQIVEVVEPNMDQVRGLAGVRGMPFIRCYFELHGPAQQNMLEVKGTHEFPGCTPRWEVCDNDAYGYGPGLEAVNDVIGLQTIEVRKAILIDKLATPPTQGGNNQMKINHRAGAHTFTPDMSGATSGRVIHPLYDVNPAGLSAIGGEIKVIEQRVRDAYFSDLFLMFAQSDRREITAREVDERHEEKLLALGPVLERLGNENLDPAISRTFNIMHRAGILPDPPKELHDTEIKVQFIGMLAQAQRAVAVGGIENLFRFVGGMAGVFPSILDKLDADQAIDEYAEATGVPAGLVVPDDKVKQIREEKEKAQQGQAALQAMQPAADVGKTLAETEVTPTNLLGQIAAGAGAY